MPETRFHSQFVPSLFFSESICTESICTRPVCAKDERFFA